MSPFHKDIQVQSEWIIKALATDKVLLDHSIRSFIDLDRYLNKYSRNGKAIRGSKLGSETDRMLFAIGAYVGETIRRNVPGALWATDEEHLASDMGPTIVLPDGTLIWPMQRVQKRFAYGSDESLYIYGHRLTQDYTNEAFDQRYREAASEEETAQKPWWRLW